MASKPPSVNRASCALAPEGDSPAAAASSPAGRARPSTSAASIAAREGSPIKAATEATSGSPRILLSSLNYQEQSSAYAVPRRRKDAREMRSQQNEGVASDFRADCAR